MLNSEEAASVTVEVLSPDKENLSEDLDENDVVQIDKARLFHLVSFNEAIQGNLLLTFNDPGIKAFAFTFGS